MFGLQFLAGWDRLHGAHPRECPEELVGGADEYDVETYSTLEDVASENFDSFSKEIFWPTYTIEESYALLLYLCEDPRQEWAWPA